jgi:hypothetical protein
MTNLFSAMLPLSIALAPAAADPDRFAGDGVTYILYPDTFRQVDDKVRQIGFSLEMDKAESELGGAVTFKGIVQVECQTRRSRMIEAELFDAKGQRIEAGLAKDDLPSPWAAFNETASDQHLYRRVCERGAAAP